MASPLVERLEKAVEGLPAKPRIMRDGVRVWVPAAVPERDDGSPVDEQFIDDLALALNTESVSVPIDGGEPGSVAHGTAHERAVGWAHRAVVVDGQLFLECEVKPEVATAIDEGRLAYSSIDAEYEVDDSGNYVPGSARLVTHALTNTPRNRGLLPMQSLRLARSIAKARLSEEKMEEETVDNGGGESSQPSTLEEALAKIAELEAKIDELESRLAAMQAAAEQLAEQASEAVDEVEQQAQETVRRAIDEGRIAESAREKWLAIARRSVESARDALALLPARRRRVVATAESAPRSDDAIRSEARQLLKLVGRESAAARLK